MMIKFALCLLVGCLSLVGCDSPRPPPQIEYRSPVQVHLLLNAPHFAEFVGNAGALDVSTCGDFTHRQLSGLMIQNEIIGTDEDPGTCAVRAREGEQACVAAPLLNGNQINVRIRGRSGQPSLTADNCRDLGTVIETWPWRHTETRYVLSFSRIEDDGNGCVYNVANPSI